jgi:hypothetical protein
MGFAHWFAGEVVEAVAAGVLRPADADLGGA